LAGRDLLLAVWDGIRGLVMEEAFIVLVFSIEEGRLANLRPSPPDLRLDSGQWDLCFPVNNHRPPQAMTKGQETSADHLCSLPPFENRIENRILDLCLPPNANLPKHASSTSKSEFPDLCISQILDAISTGVIWANTAICANVCVAVEADGWWFSSIS